MAPYSGDLSGYSGDIGECDKCRDWRNPVTGKYETPTREQRQQYNLLAISLGTKVSGIQMVTCPDCIQKTGQAIENSRKSKSGLVKAVTKDKP